MFRSVRGGALRPAIPQPAAVVYRKAIEGAGLRFWDGPVGIAGYRRGVVWVESGAMEGFGRMFGALRQR